MHGLGHWLGMNVHDVGGGGQTVFQPGMILTNEPGIYIREDALDYFDLSKPEVKMFVEKIRPAFERYKNIGVRIEDDMLITADGVEWMTKALPRKLEEVEAFIAKAAPTITIAAAERPLAPSLALLSYGSGDGRLTADDFLPAASSRGSTRRAGRTHPAETFAGTRHEHRHAE